jgi:GIY-YIG catalytic domain
MRLTEFLQSLDPTYAPKNAKVHLAVWNGREDPLDEFRAGTFDDWQCWQTKRNFQRPQVVSLIAMPEAGKWLFAGVFNSLSVKRSKKWDMWQYEMSLRPETAEMAGRLVVHFKRTARQSYLVAENWDDEMLVHSLSSEPLAVEKFPGYSNILLTKGQLDVIVRHAPESWKTALSAVCGIYVISDEETGQLYVGKACGADGFWGRWSTYSTTGHGHNTELISLLKAKGMDRAANFRFSILEIFDKQTSDEYADDRESRWKDVLKSRRPFGLNGS